MTLQRHPFMVACLVVLLCGGGVAVGQNQSTDNQPSGTKAPAPADKEAFERLSPEAKVLSKIHHTNRMEIDVGTLAEKKANSKQVREYGKRLARDHKMGDKLVRDLAKKKGLQLLQPVPSSDEEKKEMKEQKEMRKKLDELTGDGREKVSGTYF